MSEQFQKLDEASRRKVRFITKSGPLMVEDLWDLPLSSTTGKTNLDALYVDYETQLKSSTSASYVHKKANASPVLQLQFDIVKHIIDTKLAENEANATARDKAARKQEVLEIIADRQKSDLRNRPIAELQALADSL